MGALAEPSTVPSKVAQRTIHFGLSHETAARLDKLPDGFEFPAELRERISFSPERKRLVFRGFMSKADYDRLRRLSDDGPYLLALDRVFRDSASQAMAIDIGIDQVVESGHDPTMDQSWLESAGRWIGHWWVLIGSLLGAVAIVCWLLYCIH